jgi:hypothetical protein
MKDTKRIPLLLSISLLSATAFASSMSSMSASSKEILAISSNSKVLSKLEELGGESIAFIQKTSDSNYWITANNKCSVYVSVKWGYPNGEVVNGVAALPQITKVSTGRTHCEQ